MGRPVHLEPVHMFMWPASSRDSRETRAGLNEVHSAQSFKEAAGSSKPKLREKCPLISPTCLLKGIGEHLTSVGSLTTAHRMAKGWHRLQGTIRSTLPTLGAKRKLHAKSKHSAE